MYNAFIGRHNLTITILIFFIIYLIVVNLKPAFLFNRNGTIRNFGLGKSKCSIFPIWLFVIFISILIYLFVLYYIKFA